MEPKEIQVPSRILRRMGYKSDNRGIIDRYIEVNGAWNGHLQHAHNFILAAVTGKNIGNLAVFGSGWCLDLPLEELAGKVRNIQLYDLVFPAQVLHLIRKFNNVAAIKADITGGAVIKTYRAVRQFKKSGYRATAEEICNRHFSPAIVPDYSLSLNILSQIGEIITEYLKVHIPYSSEELEHIARLLQQKHLQLLPPGRSCLITDIMEYNDDLKDYHRETTEVLKVSLPPPSRSETWEWQFDQHGGYRPGKITVLKVMGMEL